MTLTQNRAQERFACIQQQSISYKFHLILNPGSQYQGLSDLSFTLTSIPKQLVVDSSAKQIKRVVVNGKKYESKENIKHQDGFLYLDVHALKQGVNRVMVEYECKYDNDGCGCVSFVDVDQKQYIYTQFEPYYANRVFALFDQPDLKATMELTIVSPMEWQKVLSNESAIVDEQFDAEKHLCKAEPHCQQTLKKFYLQAKGRFTTFPKTKLLSTYLFCFVAGPYQPLVLKQTYKNIPMSLYSIESLFPYLQTMAPFIFEITIECMKFFESFFGVEYSFSKYDQVFAHQYKFGAMENAGIVTFNDIYIWKEKVSTETMLDLANTISHELSHHWFGNLSTMKWWDDLWLNESFAQFISHLCLEKIKDNVKTIQYQSAMAAFFARKSWGYHEDQLVTTHPISGEVANTVVAESIFDGITYSKGAATLKQLLLLIGEQNFSKGLSSYFKKYGFKNATLSDFISELQIYFKHEYLTLQEWRKIWISTASLNVLEPKWNIDDKSKQSKLQIRQRPFTQQHPTLRPHQIKIALFKEDCTFDVVEAFVRAQPVTEITYNGENNYKAILLNYEDHTFAKVIIDEISLNFFSEGNLIKIPDTLTRTMIWRNFYDMVKDGIISSLKYIDIFEQNIPSEKSDSIFERNFEYIYGAINNYTPRKYREELNTRLFYFIIRLISQVNPKDENRLIILKSQLCIYAHSLIAVKILLAWREGKYSPLQNHEMTIIQKWKAVVHAFEQKHISEEDKRQLLKHQLNLDQSDTGKLEQATCKSLISSKEQFHQMYESFKDPKNEKSIALKTSEVGGWNHPYHHERMHQYEKRYFEDVTQVSKALEGDHFSLYLEQVIPSTDNFQLLIEGLKNIKFGEQQKYDKNRIDVLKMIDELKRRSKAYKRFEEFSPL